MERVAVHNSGKLREATLNGKKYIVARATLIVPGVLSGSQGALYYPPEEVAQNVDAWNGMPLVLGHPTNNGAHVSARSPDVVERFGLGYVFNAQIRKGRLVAETWFDVAQTERNAPQVLNKLRKGQPVELSTGLFTINHPAGKGAVYNGKAYQYVARSYRPDHLAILVDQPGACSLKDGCGVLAGNANPDGCNQYTGKDCAGSSSKSVSELYGTRTPAVKSKIQDIDLGPVSYLASKSPEDAIVEAEAVLKAHEGFLESYRAIAAGKQEPSGVDEKNWRSTEARFGRQMLASEWAKNYAIPQEEAYLHGVKKSISAFKFFQKRHAQKLRKKIEEDLTDNFLGNNCDCEACATKNELSGAKACEIARDGTVHGKKLTKKQKGLFGAKCGESKENPMIGNCGGKGGKPGPCPVGKKKKGKGGQAKVGDWVVGKNGLRAAISHIYSDVPANEKGRLVLIEFANGKGVNYREKDLVFSKDQTSKWAEKPTENSSEDTSMTKKDKMVRFLTANCECWKGKDDAKTLAALPDDKLKALVDNAKRAKEAAEVVGNLISTLSEDAEQPITANELPTLVANMKGAMKKGAFEKAPAEEEEAAMEEPAESDMEEMAGKKPAFMKNAKKKGKYGMSLNQERDEERAAPTLNEWLESAPPEVRSVIANAQRIEQKQKLEIVAELVGNSRAKTKADKEALHKFLMAKPLDELQTLNQLAPAPRKPEPTANALPDFGGYLTERMPDYSGLGEVEEFTANESDEDDTTLEDAPLGIPTVNWAEEAKLALPGRERK